MAIDKQFVEEFEESFKKELFDEIDKIGSVQFKAINILATSARNMGQLNLDIPNASTTLNNKLVDLSQQFKKAGISMFSSQSEHYDVVTSSILGNAIIQDLIQLLFEANEKLDKYGQIMKDICNNKNEQVKALQNVGPIRKIFSRIRSLIVPIKPVDFSLTEEEKSTLDTHLQEYIDIDNGIWNYNLEDNLVPALVKEITEPIKFGKLDIPHRYDARVIPELLEECVIPDLKKLGLEHLIPQLQEALIEEYKKDLPDPEIYQVTQEDMDSYVPNFTRKGKKGNPKERSTTTNPIKSGVSLEDLELIDETVSASERQTAVKDIQEDLQQGKEETDISLE